MKYRLTIISILLLTFSCKTDKKQESAQDIVVEKPASVANKNASSSAKPQGTETTATASVIPNHYICYTNDDNPSSRIWISFSADNKAMKLKYTGQTEERDLIFQREDYEEGGAHPTITSHYYELVNGKKIGRYRLKHSGNWDYAEYVRRDGSVFNFTIDHDADPYGKKPCF